jgi:PIN domain nuclease of toxin-antitoxin system
VKLLLDSHTLLWYALNDPKLSNTARDLVLDVSNDVLVSAVTYWEIAIKVSIGKLSLSQPYEDFIEACTKRYGFGLLGVETSHTARVAVLPFTPGHRDPFDRLLVAQSLVEGLSIVSADDALDAYGVKRLW